MNLKNLASFVVALALLFVTSADAVNHTSHKPHHIKWDPLIGAYTFMFTQLVGQDVQVYGSLVFNAGGTWAGLTTVALGQPVPGLNPCGIGSTVGTGTWEKIDCRTYKIFLTDVMVGIGSPSNEAPSCCCPAEPTFREKFEATLTLSKDGRFISSSDFTNSLWALSDLSLNSDNIVPPFALGPFIGQRVGDL